MQKRFWRGVGLAKAFPAVAQSGGVKCASLLRQKGS
jgi:hypothetical protein